ncbi:MULTISPECIES: hypothetical protein [Flammeovirga]|uniref:Uncharacterized protein n=1 Tax=Flammeovirga agarivorans TaxID=2726742 RepID=A0A7X8SGN7_9BACT|nr:MULTISPECIES: hypothetical protein [Flammeovirga]NLR89875.1 hypothetical protein [Flammeovirga agarivorans]
MDILIAITLLFLLWKLRRVIYKTMAYLMYTPYYIVTKIHQKIMMMMYKLEHQKENLKDSLAVRKHAFHKE